MIPWIIQISIISLIIIILIHYLFSFFKTNLTIPKVKDLVNKPKEQYEELYKTIQEKPKPSINNETMKVELKNYLKEISSESNKQDVLSSNTYDSNNNYYSSY
tara:strand:+ start:1629 stop:1937 length:309 start_codon:yes stop_codon:yes gene_type:complete